MDAASKISLRHALDLLHAGSEMTQKMGQTDQLRERLPEVAVMMKEIVARLEALGCDGIQVLQSNPRLETALTYLGISDGFRHDRAPRRRLGEEKFVWSDLSATLEKLEAISEQLAELGCVSFAVLRSDTQLAAVQDYYEDWKSRRLNEEGQSYGELSFGVYASPFLEQAKAIEKIIRNMLKLDQSIRLDLRQEQLTVSCGPLSFAIAATYEKEGTQFVHANFFRLLLYAIQHDEWLQCEVSRDRYVVNRRFFQRRHPSN